MPEVIIAANSGSSSLKFALYPVEAGAPPLLEGEVTGIGTAPDLDVTYRGADVEPTGPLGHIPKDADHGWLITRLLARLRDGYADYEPVAIGHRIVHGGQRFGAPVRIDGEVREALGALIPLAPLHQPHNLAAVDAVAEAAPGLPQVACFDTGFHRTMPEIARTYPIPRRLT